MNQLGKESVARLRIDEGGAGQRLDNFLFKTLKGVPKSHVYRIIRSGEVRVNGRRAEAETRLIEGDELRLPPIRVADKAPVPANRSPVEYRLRGSVLYEDEALLVINKPAGMAVHGGSGISRGVVEQLRLERPEARFLELAHRLDRETSGVLLLAKKRSALNALHEAFREGRVEKRYFALVKGRWRDEVRNVRLPLLKTDTPEGEKRVRVHESGQEAHTIFRLVRCYEGFSLLEAELLTGRTHQIRVHLSHLRFPICGDDKYGDFPLNKELARQGLKRMFLHASKTVIAHPLTGERLELSAPLPPELENFLRSLPAAG
jgi:23S rRNA pseudouridine955/2504/2580 synthase